jgi:hypothetical protein
LQLPLIPVAQFLAEHPEHAGADENALMIARIDHEHAERLALEEQRQGLLKKKQGLIADNKKRKDDLANLDKDLEKFIDVSYCISVAGIYETDQSPGCETYPKDVRESGLNRSGTCSSIILSNNQQSKISTHLHGLKTLEQVHHRDACSTILGYQARIDSPGRKRHLYRSQRCPGLEAGEQICEQEDAHSSSKASLGRQ